MAEYLRKDEVEKQLNDLYKEVSELITEAAKRNHMPGVNSYQCQLEGFERVARALGVEIKDAD